jgi:4-hydroxybenzoate polyprenyltransferase
MRAALGGRLRMRRVADLLFLARPPLLCASSAFFFAGAVSALATRGQSHTLQLMLGVLPNLALFVLVVSAAFIVNQIYDMESDRVNRKSFLLSDGIVSRRHGMMALAAVSCAALGLSLLYDSEVRYLAWLGLLLGFAYSVPPVRLKGRPVLDMIANVVGFGVIGFAMGWLAYAEISRLLWIRCSAYALAMCAIFLNTCIPDEQGDRKVGDRTSCVVFGSRAMANAVLMLMLGSAVVGVLTGEVVCALAVVGSLPAVVAVSVEQRPANSVVASQYAARLLLVLVCVKAPLLAAFSVLTYVGSRAYYRKRFGLRYPDLTGAAEPVPPSS